MSKAKTPPPAEETAAPVPVPPPPSAEPPADPASLAEAAAAALAESDRAEFRYAGQLHVAVRDSEGAIYIENRGA